MPEDRSDRVSANSPTRHYPDTPTPHSNAPHARLLRFTLTETGIGMTAGQLSRLFQPFTQAEASTKKKSGGTGLGLALSQKFCKMMGGEITVESEPAKGSTFTVSLPGVVEAATAGS